MNKLYSINLLFISKIKFYFYSIFKIFVINSLKKNESQDMVMVILFLLYLISNCCCIYKYSSAHTRNNPLRVYSAENKCLEGALPIFSSFVQTKKSCVVSCFIKRKDSESINVVMEGSNYRCDCLAEHGELTDSESTTYYTKNEGKCSNYCKNTVPNICGKCKCVSFCSSPLPCICDCTKRKFRFLISHHVTL